MRDTPTRRFRCLDCHKQLDSALDAYGDKQPRPGNLCICIDCGHIMVFGDDMWPRNPTREEQIDMAGDPKILIIQKILGQYKRERGR